MAKTKYRQDGRDTMTLANSSAAGTTEGNPPGALPPSRVPVFSHDGQRLGHVSAKTGSAAIANRLGARNAIFRDGAWHGRKPVKAQVSKLPLAASLKTAKGSISK